MFKFLPPIFFVAYFSCISFQGIATDVIRFNDSPSNLDVRGLYIENLMIRALRISREKYGPFVLERLVTEFPAHRVLQALEDGELINVAMAMTSTEWEEKAIPVRIPLRRGIFKYRLLLVHSDDLEKFSTITTVKQFKDLTVGVKRSWTIRSILSTLGFNIVDAYSYDAVFEMLHKKRFDFTIRGIHEVYDELRLRKRFFDDLVIEPNILLYMPAPSYFFVSPKYPKIAERFEYGLEQMVASGELKRLFAEAFTKYIDISDLRNRRIIEIGNPLLPEKTPLERKELWVDFHLEDD